jgi:hypothetical protein
MVIILPAYYSVYCRRNISASISSRQQVASGLPQMGEKVGTGSPKGTIKEMWTMISPAQI